MGFSRRILGAAALAGCLVLSGCGARTEKAAEQGVADAPGVLVFSGLTSGSYLHAIRSDGSDLRGVGLPKDCSPESFTRGGRTLVCIDLSDNVDLDHWKDAFERKGSEWRRVPMPAEQTFPQWADPLKNSDVDAPQWAPAGDRIAFIRPTDGPYWFSSSGKVAVADANGSNEHAVAVDGQAPQWSPDGKRLAFARCRVFEPNWEEDDFARETAECSLWTVPADGREPAQLLVEDTASVPVWSPDGRFVAFYRESRPCETFCRSRVFVVPATGGDPQKVGPELVLANDDRFGRWPGLDWLPESAPVIVPKKDDSRADELELQRCVDIWNRARMYAWPTGAVNVRVTQDRCQVTLSAYGGVCTQSEEMTFRFWCPSHGAGLHQLPPEDRVWNAHGARDGQLSLFEPPKGPRLQLPKAPPHPMLDGYVIPYGKDGEVLRDLELTEAVGTCERGTGIGGGDRYPLGHPDTYPLRCWWPGRGSDDCFKHPGRVDVGDIALCPDSAWEKAYNPMHFFKVRVAKLL